MKNVPSVLTSTIHHYPFTIHLVYSHSMVAGGFELMS